MRVPIQVSGNIRTMRQIVVVHIVFTDHCMKLQSTFNMNIICIHLRNNKTKNCFYSKIKRNWNAQMFILPKLFHWNKLKANANAPDAIISVVSIWFVIFPFFRFLLHLLSIHIICTVHCSMNLFAYRTVSGTFHFYSFKQSNDEYG